ncbi:MAG TPA: response regulator [Opitutaceae bacterium]|jgi:PAS domain S-box-containing protein|nr:response regulator [Opitutaceae bacterium]
MPQTLKVLVAEDNPADAELLVRELRRAGFEPDWKRVDTEKAYLEHLHDGLDLVLSDYQMPEFSGLRALELLKQRDLEVPFIIVSGTIGEDTAVAAMKQGATDYLLKDRLTRLGSAVSHALESSRLRAERRSDAAQLRLQGAALATAANAIIITDPKGSILWSNPAFTTLTGYTAAEAAGQTPRLLKSGQHDATFYRELWGTILSGRVWRGELINRRKDGSFYHGEQTITPVRDEAGVITHFIGVMNDVTARKRAEEEARETHKRLQELLEYSPAVLYALKLEGERIVPYMVSENMMRLLGFTVAESLSHAWWLGQLHPDDRDRAVASMAETIANGTSRTEYRLRHKDGSYRWVDDNRRLMRNATGAPAELVGIWADITEHKRAEETMQQASGRVTRDRRNRVRIELAILFLATALIFTLAARFEWFEAGTRWVQAYDAIQLDDIVVTAIFFAAGLAIFAFRRWRESESELTSQQQVQAALGLLHDELDRQVKQRTAELDRVNQALRAEITERKRTETVLQESNRRFHEMLENLELIAMTLDKKGTVTFCNDFLLRLAGWKREEVIGKSWFDKFLPDSAAAVKQLFLDTIDSGKVPPHQQNPIKTRTGELREIVWSNTLLKDGTGNIVGAASIGEDITERRTLEEQLRQAQKMEAIGTLAGGIAHDFNNILSAILGYTQLSQMVLKENPEVRGYLNAVLQASSRATDLVRQILTFSRQQPQERHLIQLQPVVEETLKLLRSSIPSTIEFDLSLATDAPTVLADATQIHQILMNLGTNAWHAMKDRPGRLQVKLEKYVVDAAQATSQPQLKPGLYARVSVSDTGRGMDPATLRRIFEPFFTTKPPGEGTGLGLAVVHGIMKDHDGAVTVYSQPGEGTIFHLYFPAHAGKAPTAIVEQGPVPPGHGERVLFVDDEEVLVQLGQKTLTELGYEVEVATEPAVALAMVRADPQRFALVITDQTMPEMTGLVLAGQLLRIRPKLPIIITTGYNAALTAAQVEAVGIRQLLFKPITVQSLGTAVHAILSAKSATRILLIDDDDPFRTMLRLTLAHFGYIVIEARNGKEGLALFKEADVDLVITDIVMPEKEGLEVLMELRTRQLPPVKIIAISGGARVNIADNLRMAKLLGAAKVLTKPFSNEAMIAAINELLPGDGN